MPWAWFDRGDDEAVRQRQKAREEYEALRRKQRENEAAEVARNKEPTPWWKFW